MNATEEMSTLVNYIEPVKFKSFEVATSKCLCVRVTKKGTEMPSLCVQRSDVEEKECVCVCIRGLDELC